MANVYKIMIINSTGPGGSSWREEVIVTDTLQSAMSIGKAHCKWNEEVDEIYTIARDVVIDSAAVKSE